MKDIEKLLVNSNKEFEIPQKVHYRVQYTLENKNKTKSYYFVKKLVTTFATLILVLIGTVGVYAVCGGKIQGKPVIEWLGIKVPEEYEEYKEKVSG